MLNQRCNEHGSNSAESESFLQESTKIVVDACSHSSRTHSSSDLDDILKVSAYKGQSNDQIQEEDSQCEVTTHHNSPNVMPSELTQLSAFEAEETRRGQSGLVKQHEMNKKRGVNLAPLTMTRQNQPIGKRTLM